MGRSRVRTSTAILDKQALWRDLVHRDQCISVCNFLCNFWTKILDKQLLYTIIHCNRVTLYSNILYVHQVWVHFALFAQKEGVETLNWLSIQALCPDFGSCWDDEAGWSRTQMELWSWSSQFARSNILESNHHPLEADQVSPAVLFLSALWETISVCIVSSQRADQTSCRLLALTNWISAKHIQHLF